MYLVAGGYLSFFFMISHNFEGAQALTDTTRPSNKGCEKNSFLYKQVPLIINPPSLTNTPITNIYLNRLLLPQMLVVGGFVN